MSTETPTEPNVEEPTPSHYRFMFQGSKIDPYRIFTIYGITHPAQQHAIKKLLRAGQSHKGLAQDIGEVIQALNRWLEMISESEPKLITELEQQISGKTEERTPDPGNGFRLLRKGELIPIDAEYLSEGEWIKTSNPGIHVGEPGAAMCTYRVPYTPPFPGHPSPPHVNAAPDPGEGFRLLEKGEVIPEGAEFYSNSMCKWKKSSDVGQSADSLLIYRVPIEKPKEPVKAPDELREFVSSGAWTEDTLKMVEIIASRFESIEAQLQQNKQ